MPAPDGAPVTKVSAEARAYLLSLGVDLTSEQQTKTKTALEFFTSAKQNVQR